MSDGAPHRPHYEAAWKALQEAHDACFNHPDRDVLGLSSGPFSGVNAALQIVQKLETDLATEQRAHAATMAYATKIEAELASLRLCVKDLQINSPAQAALDEIARLEAENERLRAEILLVSK